MKVVYTSCIPVELLAGEGGVYMYSITEAGSASV